MAQEYLSITHASFLFTSRYLPPHDALGLRSPTLTYFSYTSHTGRLHGLIDILTFHSRFLFFV